MLLELNGPSEQEAPKAFDLLLYYGVVGLVDVAASIYIYDTQYDTDIMSALIRQKGVNPSYEINPALWPILRIKNANTVRG